MNKKIVKMPILFVLILCMCFVFVGCGKQAISSKETPPEGISQEVYDDTLVLLQEAGEHLKEGDDVEADKVLMEYEKAHPITTGRVGERPVGEDKDLAIKSTNFMEKCIYYLDKKHYEGSLNMLEVRDEEDIYMKMQQLVNMLEKGYTIDIQEDKIIIEEVE